MPTIRIVLSGLLVSVIAGCSGQGAEAGSGGAGAGSGTAGSAAAGGSASNAGGSASAGAATGGTSVGGGGSGATESAGGAAGSSGGIPGAGGSNAPGSSGSAGGGAAGAAGGGPVTLCSGTPDHAVTVHMIGDSTASVYASNLHPRMGWGQPLGELFDAACATVSDKALSGRSSKSFFDEGHWTPVRDALQGGDYVLIQFGHNDEKSDDPLRYTEPQTTFKQYLTTYVEETRARQATPLLLTPIHRNNWSGTALKDTHGAYPAAMRELAEALDVELIDMTALTQEYFERIGQVETTKLFLVLAAGASPNYPDGVTDNTHLQEYGARKIGQLAMADAYAQGFTLASYLNAVPVAP